MTCTFPSGEISSIDSAPFVSLKHLLVQGSTSSYYLLAEGYACLQVWEAGYYQVLYCCARLREPITLEFRHTGVCETLIINLAGNLMLTEYQLGKQVLNNQYGMLFLQEHVQGFCTLRGIRNLSRILMIIHTGEQVFLPTPERAADHPVFAISKSMEKQAGQLLHNSYLDPAHFSMDVFKELFSEAYAASVNALNKTFLLNEELNIVRELKTWIDSHIDGDHSMDQLSRKAGMDQRKLRVGFRRLYGKNIFDYIREERLLISHEKIVSTQLQLKVIGRWAGYRSYSNFSAAFKTHFGYTPASLRK